MPQQNISVQSEKLMTEVELLEHHSKLGGGEGKEVLTWKVHLMELMTMR